MKTTWPKSGLKVFSMNDYDRIIAFSAEEANEWYKTEFGLNDEDQPLDEVCPVLPRDTMWYEICCGDEPEIEIAYGPDVEFGEWNGNPAFKKTYAQVAWEVEASGYDGPFVVASTEC